jgi:hypothetical protein
MKKMLLMVLGVAAIMTCTTAEAILITDFGSGSYFPVTWDFDVIQTGGEITLEGAEGNFIYGELVNPVDIQGFVDFLTITGVYTGDFDGQFVVELLDGDGDSLVYNGFYSDFSPGVSSTFNLAFVEQTGTFDGMVTGVLFTAGGAGTLSTDVVLSSLSAVPEPASWALIAGGLTTILACRRRRVA